MTGDHPWARTDAALFRRSFGNVLVRLPEGPMRTLVGTAAEVWELLGHSSTVGELADTLAARYETPAAEMLPDLTGLLDTLATAGLVTPCPGASTAVPVA